MLNTILLYLLVGTFAGFLLEKAVRANGDKVNGWERFSIITLWPLMTAIFIFSFIKGMFND
tara:strand:+ start:768 stop:950 length:183 start_codon:yes stop_codon:yes gene_type:complete